MKVQNLILGIMLFAGVSAFAQPNDDISNEIQHGKIEAAMSSGMEQMVQGMETKLAKMEQKLERRANPSSGKPRSISGLGQLIDIAGKFLAEAKASKDYEFVSRASKEFNQVYAESELIGD